MFGKLMAVASLALVAAHLTGNLKVVGGWFDIGIDPQHIIYLLAMPFVCLVGLVMLSDSKN